MDYFRILRKRYIGMWDATFYEVQNHFSIFSSR